MEFLLYDIKASVCLIGFYLLYKQFMSCETFVRMNRIVILSAIGVSFVLPKCGITLEPASHGIINDMSLSVIFDEISVVSGSGLEENMVWKTIVNIPWKEIIVAVYLLGVVFFVVRWLMSLVHVAMKLSGGDRKRLDGGVVLVLKEGNEPAFSWLHYVLMGREVYEDKGSKTVLIHELAHIGFGHSVDLLAVDIACCIMWFNPAMWLMRSELCTVHEYEADKAVLDSGADAKQYKKLLVEKAAGSEWSSITNSFNRSNLNNRITMMQQKRSSVWARAKVLYALPIIGGAMIAFANVACSESEDNENVLNGNVVFGDNLLERIKQGEVQRTERYQDADGSEGIKYYLKSGEELVSKPDGEETFMIVEDMPKFPGGGEALREYLAANVKYPQEAIDKQIEGKVFVSFVIDADGNVVELSLPKATDTVLDSEALRVVGSMPKWEPGRQRGKAVRVSYVVPINFTLN